MKRKISKLGLVAMTGIIFGSCDATYSGRNMLSLSFDTGRVTKVDKINDLIYLDTNKRKGADVYIDGALSRDSSRKRGDYIFYGYDSLKRIDTIKKIDNNIR